MTASGERAEEPSRPVLDFSGLYREHAEGVRRFAYFLSGDRELAEDLVAETFVRLWGARQRVELATVRGYLYTIARNLYLHEIRHRHRRLPLEDVHPDQGPGPEAQAVARGELAATLAGLARLSEIDRAALLMRALDELPYEEIGAALGVTASTARVKVHRARLQLAASRQPEPDKTSPEEPLR